MKRVWIHVLLAVNALVFLAIFFVEKRVEYVPCKHLEISCKPEHLDGAKKLVALQQRIDEIEALRNLYTEVSDKLTKEYEQIEGDVSWYEAVEMCTRGDKEMCQFITDERLRKLDKENKI